MSAAATAPSVTSKQSQDVTEITHWINGAPVKGTSGRFSDVFHPTRAVCSPAFRWPPMPKSMPPCRPPPRPSPPGPRSRRSARPRHVPLPRNTSSRGTKSRAINREHGKVFSDAKGEVHRGLENIEFATAIPQLLKGEFTEQVGTGIDSWSMRQPLGVVAGITPFNFPAMVPLWMFPLALACGNTFILKPCERDPSASILLAEMLKEAGLPDGVFNVVHGDKNAVDAILAHPTIQAVSFVGSTAIAEYVYATGTQHGKRVQALGGAKNHMIVMPDADLDQAADALVGSAYGSAGERCMAISVAVAVGKQTADDLSPNSNPASPNSTSATAPQVPGEADFGPLITGAHRDKVRQLHRHRQIRRRRPRHRRPQPRRSSLTSTTNGFFLGATLFDHVKPEMRIYREEIFGPVLGVVRVNNFEKALELINQHEYGNGTSIFTRDGDTARDFGRRVQAGMVGINVPIPVPMAFHSFGGWKRSSSATTASTAPKASASTPASKPSPPAGPPASAPASTPPCPPSASAFHSTKTRKLVLPRFALRATTILMKQKFKSRHLARHSNIPWLGRTRLVAHLQSALATDRSGKFPPLSIFLQSPFPWIRNYVRGIFHWALQALPRLRARWPRWHLSAALRGRRRHYPALHRRRSGNGTQEAYYVAEQMKAFRPDYTIHLGDVYYVGDEPEVQENFFGIQVGDHTPVAFPRGAVGTLTLPGNHELTAGQPLLHAGGALGVSSTGSKTARRLLLAQLPEHWRIIGLDTGYNSTGIAILGLFPGWVRFPLIGGDAHLEPAILDWLRTNVRPRENPKTTLLLSHHQYFSAFPDEVYPRSAEQLREFFHGQDLLWLWGHEHRLAIYDLFSPDGNLRCFGRCIGHGGMPVDITPPEGNRAPLVFDDPRHDYPIGMGDTAGWNGFVNLTLQGPRLTLDFRDLNGRRMYREAFLSKPGGGIEQVASHNARD